MAEPVALRQTLARGFCRLRKKLQDVLAPPPERTDYRVDEETTTLVALSRRAHIIPVPSGDHRGFTNSPIASVNCITPVPSRFITNG